MTCGAKRRDGGICQAKSMPNGRCFRHGGKTPKRKLGVKAVTDPIEAAARALAMYEYDRGADPQGMDKHQWAEAAWQEFKGQAVVATDAFLKFPK